MLVCTRCRHENRDTASFCENCAEPLTALAERRELRKTVTVLFCDVTGSTALAESTDPEALRALLARYFERMKGIVESHGASVEKFIGDAVMAVFGTPQVHEDDALRACRAAVEMLDALPELGLQARIGINTGEVVIGTEERLATGDAVNVAARLEQAARPGEILIGADVLALVHGSVETGPAGPLELKGKSAPVSAHRLVSVRAGPERSHETTFVGRTSELEGLRRGWRRACDGPRCELMTVVGEAGVGKSRLVAEALGALDGRVVSGRCLPYGEGITYWPVVEVLKQLDVLPTDPAAAASLRSLLGDTESATTAEEIAWAFRKLLDEQAQAQPLVVVFDDIHWAEDTFLDLIEHVALLSADAPILLLCVARPELLDRRPTWSVTLRLELLDEGAVEELIPPRMGKGQRERIARAAGGNPLFVSEMLAMSEQAGGDIAVPPTLQALLAARLDQLNPSERRVLECASVEGVMFHRGAVQALAPDEPRVTIHLASLVRRELIRTDRGHMAAEDGFRFQHLLIRDAAYDALAKTTRSELHERYADWLDGRGRELVGLDEILGFHLEQAARYRRELGMEYERLAALARERLMSAGRRALDRLDFGSAARLLGRAAELLPPPGVDLGVETDLIDALLWDSRSEEALDRARSVSERAAVARDRVGELCGQIHEATLLTSLQPEGATDALEALVAGALPVFEAAHDELALRIADRALGTVANIRMQMDQMAAAYEQALARRAHAGTTALVGYQGHARFYGSTPTTDLLAWQDEQDLREQRGYWLRTHRIAALAMLEHFDQARALLEELRAELIERGARSVLAPVQMYAMDIETLAGNSAAAVAAGEAGCRLLEELGLQSELSTAAAGLARAYCDLDRLNEAERWAARAAELGSNDDASTQMLWRDAQAIVLARRGEHGEARRLARQAVEIGEQTETLNYQAATYSDLGEVLMLAGRIDEAADALEQALDRYERKKNLAMVAQVRPRLKQLRANVN